MRIYFRLRIEGSSHIPASGAASNRTRKKQTNS
jgi:hypothetical protein